MSKAICPGVAIILKKQNVALVDLVSFSEADLRPHHMAPEDPGPREVHVSDINARKG
uniref:Uncharacterized protein n=1 Tax=Onchocerca volvulus TaxID=6282 RepID=A0A8R1TJU6_ONCVO